MKIVSPWTMGVIALTEESCRARNQKEKLCAPVASYEQMLTSGWLARSGLTRTVEHPYLGAQDVFVAPWRFAGVTAGRAAPAPLLGQHTQDVFGAMPAGEPEGAASAAR